MREFTAVSADANENVRAGVLTSRHAGAVPFAAFRCRQHLADFAPFENPFAEFDQA